MSNYRDELARKIRGARHRAKLREGIMEDTLLDYAMAIAHERELEVLGHPHDTEGAVRRFNAACQRRGEPAEQYNHKRIGWELERTAMGDGYYGNALRVAKDIPGLTDRDRTVLDRYATGLQRGTDRIALQDIAMRVSHHPQPAEPSRTPKLK